MDGRLREIGERIQAMREILGLEAEEMAKATDCPADDYTAIENGERDFSFTFLYKAANRLGLDLTELLSGETPRRSGYTLVRAGQGLPIERRAGFRYQSLAPFFAGRRVEPFLVDAPYHAGQEELAITLSSHAGQELDYVLEGRLRCQIGEQEETLEVGDALYYDSGKPHGMLAVGGVRCRFLAVVVEAEGDER